MEIIGTIIDFYLWIIVIFVGLMIIIPIFEWWSTKSTPYKYDAGPPRPKDPYCNTSKPSHTSSISKTNNNQNKTDPYAYYGGYDQYLDSIDDDD